MVSGNTTTDKYLYNIPEDHFFKYLSYINDVTLVVVVFGLVLGMVAMSSSLTSLYELSQSSVDRKTEKPLLTEGWIVRKLKSKYASRLIVCGNSSILAINQVMFLMLYFDVGRAKTCAIFASVTTSFYLLSLWTSYLLFEVRRMSTCRKEFNGIKYWIKQAVRFATLGMPVFAILGYKYTFGVYVPEARTCVFTFDGKVSVLFGVFDSFLSIVSSSLPPGSSYLKLTLVSEVSVAVTFKVVLQKNWCIGCSLVVYSVVKAEVCCMLKCRRRYCVQ
jgi:hypothetical protein